MRKVEFVPFKLTDKAEIYSIRVDDRETTEFQEFIVTYKNTEDIFLEDDYNSIIRTLIKMASEGISESLFRPEGSIKDRICALPLFSIKRDKGKHGTLRLYCIRISDKIIILGGGGEKSTRTYQEDISLNEKVELLQQIDRELSIIEDNGIDLSVELNNIILNI